MPQFVLDCSVTMVWCFRDEVDTLAIATLKSMPPAAAIVPAIWPLEVLNVLAVAERRGRLTESESAGFLDLLASLPITVDTRHALKLEPAILDLSRAHGLASYDAAYLDLAVAEQLPLATNDARMSAAAARLRVDLYQPA